MEKKHIASLDGLRGLAAFFVVLSHLSIVFPGIHLPYAASIGSDAVALFFALSGFLMAALYGRKPLTMESGLRFLVSRMARIYPVYLFAVGLTVLLGAIPALHYFEPISGVVEITRHVLMIGSAGVFWSVPPEIQFYFVFPLIWFGLSRPSRFRKMLGVLLALIAVDGLLGFPGPGILLSSKLHFFIGGVLAGHFHHRLAKVPANGLHAAMALIGTLILFGYQTALPQLDEPNWGLPTALLAAMIVSSAAREHAASKALFASRPLRFVGEISFSLYLLHMPAMILTTYFLGPVLPQPVVLALSLVMTIVVAAISNRLIERPSRAAIVAMWDRHGRAFAAGVSLQPAFANTSRSRRSRM